MHAGAVGVKADGGATRREPVLYYRDAGGGGTRAGPGDEDAAMKASTTAARIIAGPALALAALAGCENFKWGGRKELPPEPPPEERSARSNDPLISGTIGEASLMAGEDPQVMRGFGVVVGLDGTGSADCPTVIRDYLLEYLAKQTAPQGTAEWNDRVNPTKLLDSPDTAVVEVLGLVPAGALSGTRFDVLVRTLPGTAAESLVGGLLLPTQLRYFDRAATGQGLIMGAVLAEAAGPVFVNPFAEDAGADSQADPRRGSVLGGGRAIEKRTVRLSLMQPNYALARAVERRINERFGQKPPVAGAWSRGYLVLETPPAYAERPELFRRLVAHLYVDRAPGFTERRLQDLTRVALSAEVDYEHLSLAWESFGRSVIPHIQPLYAHHTDTVRFFAARAGLRVGDTVALPVMAELARTAPHSLRLLALRELGFASSPQAALPLVEGLSDPDQELRVEAYEGLLRHGHPAIRTTPFPHLLDPSQLNFCLDIVDCEGPPLIHIRRTRAPRIAVFGRQMPVMPPIFYTGTNELLTVHTIDGGDDVRLFAKRNQRLSDEIVIPPRVVELITALAHLPLRDDAGRLAGLGLPYTRVVRVLTDLAQDEAIPAPVVFEQTTITDLLGPQIAPQRPEFDEPEQDTPAPAPAAPADDEPPQPAQE